LVAAFIIFIQKNYKRLLAYSSIEHMGVMALGFGFGGIGASAALLHMIYHSLAKSLLFLSSGHIFLKFSSTKIIRIKGVMSVLPFTGVSFIVGFLAITGVPPFGIFITEFTILSAGIQNHPVVTILALFGLTLVFIGFFKHTIAMMFGENEADIQRGEAGPRTMAPIVLLAAMLAITSIYVPSFLARLIHAASAAH
jgi:hydrogenase-4 component F